MADDVNSMQDSLGLDMGPPVPAMRGTAPMEMPVTRHPGQAAAELSAQTRAEIESARNAIAPLSMPSSAIYNPAAGAVYANGNPVAGFGAQYAANMQAIAAGHLSPYSASMYGMGPIPGFNAGMMPSAGNLTDPAYGIYRTRPPSGFGMPAYPMVPREPFIGGPLYQGLAEQMYSTPSGLGSDLAMMRSAQYHGMATAAVSVPTRIAIGMGGSYLGGGIGTAVGAALGGPLGATVGGIAGNMLGGYLADSTVGEAAANLLQKNPLTNLAQRAAQVQTITSGFVTGGANLGMAGRGVDSSSAIDIARTIQRTGYAESTGFNAADLAKIMDQGGRAGLFDAVQGAGDIKGKVMSTANTLKQFMQITNDADITNAIKELGNMRTMGLSQHEALQAAQNARMFARSAGTSLQALQSVGQAGAMTFQGQGLSAGLGAQIGQGAYAAARQAVMSGSMTEQQLALQGGVSGVAQHMMEATGATLKIPMLTSAVSKMTPNGTFGLDAKAVADLAAGKIDVFDMARMSGENMSAAIGQRGPSALAMYKMQENELQDQLGRAIGPTGMQMMPFIQANLVRQRLNQPDTPEGFATGAQVLFNGDTRMANTLSLMAANRDFFKNQLQAIEVEQNQRAGVNYANFRKGVDSYDPDTDLYKRFVAPVTARLGRVGELGSDLVDSTSRGLTRAAEDSAKLSQGELTYRFSSNATMESAAERAALTRNASVNYLELASPDVRRALSTDNMHEGLTSSAKAEYVDLMSGEGSGWRSWRNKLGRILTNARSDESDADVAQYSGAAQEMSAMLNATPGARGAAASNLRSGFADEASYQQKLYEYKTKFAQVADAAGPNPWTGFQGRAARVDDLKAIDADFGGEEMGRQYRMVLGDSLKAGTRNPAFFNTVGRDAVDISAQARQVSAAVDASLADTTRMMFGTSSASSAQNNVTKKLLTDTQDQNAVVLAGLLGVESLGTAADAAKSREAQGRFAALAGFTPSSGDKTYAAAAALQASVGQMPNGPEILQSLGKQALAMDPDVMAQMVQERRQQFFANTQVSEGIKAAYALQPQTNPTYFQELRDLSQTSGVGAMLSRAAELQSGGANVFNEGTASARALQNYMQAGVSSTEAVNKFQEALQSGAALSKEGSIGLGQRDPGLQAAANIVSGTNATMASLFPEAVGTFQASATEMLKAAKLLQDNARRGSTTQLEMPYSRGDSY